MRFNRVLNRMRDLANAKELNAMLIDTCVIPPLNEGDTGYVYLVGYEKFVKIGWTKAFRHRISSLQNGIPQTLLIYAIISAQPEFEEILHHRFVAERAKNEWFFLKGDLEKWIKGGCHQEHLGGTKRGTDWKSINGLEKKWNNYNGI